MATLSVPETLLECEIWPVNASGLTFGTNALYLLR
jgi:hypothetical protein